MLLISWSLVYWYSPAYTLAFHLEDAFTKRIYRCSCNGKNIFLYLESFIGLSSLLLCRGLLIKGIIWDSLGPWAYNVRSLFFDTDTSRFGNIIFVVCRFSVLGLIFSGLLVLIFWQVCKCITELCRHRSFHTSMISCEFNNSNDIPSPEVKQVAFHVWVF